MSIKLVKANLTDATHQAAIVAMMDAYSNDPMGDGKPLSDYARQNLISGLIEHPTTLIFLVFEGLRPSCNCHLFSWLLNFRRQAIDQSE